MADNEKSLKGEKIWAGVYICILLAGVYTVATIESRARETELTALNSQLRTSAGLVDSWQGMARELRIQLHDICLDNPKHSSCVWLKEDFDQRG